MGTPLKNTLWVPSFFSGMICKVPESNQLHMWQKKLTLNQANTRVAELGLAQPQLVLYFVSFALYFVCLQEKSNGISI